MRRSIVSVVALSLAALVAGGCNSVESLGHAAWPSEKASKEPGTTKGAKPLPPGSEAQQAVGEKFGPGVEAIRIVSNNPLGNDMKIIAVRNTVTENVKFFHMGSRGVLKSVLPATAQALGLWAAYEAAEPDDFRVAQNDNSSAEGGDGFGFGGDGGDASADGGDPSANALSR